MDRQIVNPSQIALDSDILLTNKNAFVAMSKIIEAILGTATLLSGFACTPTSPASMSVDVAGGQIFSLQNVDNTAYGSVASDTAHQIMKQGVSLDKVTLNCPAPVTVGYSINYLIQIAFSEADSGDALRTYYNSSNPASPWTGANNSGVADKTVRQNRPVITVKAGAAATTGTQTTPTPDAGNVVAWVVTVAYGAVTITAPNIAAHGSAPFITETLTQKISAAGLSGVYALVASIQSQGYTYAADTGAVNAYVVALAPALGAYGNGKRIQFKATNANTGASTVNVNGLGVRSITRNDGTPLRRGDIPAGGIVDLIDDGSKFLLQTSARDFGTMPTVASAATVDLGAQNSNAIAISGAGTITSFGSSASLLAPIYYCRLTGAASITHNGTSLICPGGASITGAAGDAFFVEYLGSGNWRITNYQRADGKALASAVTYADVNRAPDIILEDQKAQNTSAGTNTAATFQKRTLNTEVYDPNGWCSLASDQFTLAAGNYYIVARVPYTAVSRTSSRLRNATAGTTLLPGTSTSSYATGGSTTSVTEVRGTFTVAAGQALELQGYGELSVGTTGMGQAANAGPEKYATVELWRLP
ncbi:MAG: hypothetical protein ABW199_09295 [Caulobacterales bacterium]